MTGEHEIPEKVLSRLKGAYRLLNESKNPGEVAAATARVQEILEKYNISIEIFSTLDEDRKVIERRLPGTGKNHDKVLCSLANTLGIFNFVKIIRTHTRAYVGNEVSSIPVIAFIGLPMNVDTVFNLTVNLNWRLRSLADDAFKEYKARCKRVGIVGEHGKAWIYSWLMGAVNGIYTQLQEKSEQFKKQEFTNASGQVKTGNEIIIVRGTEVAAYVKEHYPKLKAGTTAKIQNRAAFDDGFETGLNININQKELR